MVNEIEIKEINVSDTKILQKFIDEAGNSTNSFRYFNTRPLNIISNHLLTLIACLDEFPVGYAHLDKEDDKVWLGIAISENNIGKGIGKVLMNSLLEYVDNSIINEVFLSVDITNVIAQNMYKKYGFKTVKELSNGAYLMKRYKNI